MDSILGRWVRPKTTEKCLIIKPISRTFVTGIAKHYHSEYNAEVLAGYLTESEFYSIQNNLNESV